MPHDLDAEWRAEVPPPSLDDLQLHWAGVDLTRLEEVPIEALRWFDQAMEQEGSGIGEIITAISMSLAPECRERFTEVAEGVSVGRLMFLWQRLAELSARRPTGAASDSGSGRSENGTTSTGASPTSVVSTSPGSGTVDSSTPSTPSSSPGPQIAL